MHLQTSGQPALDLGFRGHSCNWGTHIAGLYQTAEERDEIILGFLHRGDTAGDLQLYCPSERSIRDFERSYERYYPGGMDHLVDSNRFQVFSARDLYYPNGTFSPWTMDHGLATFFARSQRRGPRNIRATAEMVWALEAIPGVEHLMAYEARLNHFILGKPWVSICMYNVMQFPGEMIMNVLRTHPYTISGGVITQNPYYEDPAAWLARNAPGFLADTEVPAGVRS